jgi:hypothetical protein
LLITIAAALAGGILDDGGIGVAAAMGDEGELAVGPALTDLAGDISIQVLFADPDDYDMVVRAWEVRAGGWSPSYLGNRSKRRKAKARAEAPDMPPPPIGPPPVEKVKLLQGNPTIAVGGDAWNNERFYAELGGTGMLDLLAPGGTPPTKAYVGPTFGGRAEVVYPRSRDNDAPAGGGVLIDAGLAAGVVLGVDAILRMDASAEIDPFILDSALVGRALVSASLDRAEVPLAVRVEGKVEADPDADFALDWRALVAVVIVP